MKLKNPFQKSQEGSGLGRRCKRSGTSRVALNNRVEINTNISAVTVNTKEPDS